MLAHVSIQCANPAASRAFYAAVLEPLGGQPLIVAGEHVGFGRDATSCLFFIGPVNTSCRADQHLGVRRNCSDGAVELLEGARPDLRR